jgi:hypothetical protein
MLNWKGCGRKQSLQNLKYYPGILLEGLNETIKKRHNSRFPKHDLNQDIRDTKRRCWQPGSEFSGDDDDDDHVAERII